MDPDEFFPVDPNDTPLLTSDVAYVRSPRSSSKLKLPPFLGLSLFLHTSLAISVVGSWNGGNRRSAGARGAVELRGEWRSRRQARGAASWVSRDRDIEVRRGVLLFLHTPRVASR